MLLKVYKSRVWIMLFMLLPFIGKAQLPPNLPTGWEFTLNPTSATYAIPTTVAFNGVDALQAGDWIGAFYDDAGVLKCAGAVEWTGTENVALVAFGNDELEPVKNGFFENELVQWKFYRTATSTEECVKAFDALNAEFYWTNGDLDEVASFGPCEIICEQSFNFTAGWNWISFNVLPELADLNSVLGNGYTNGDFIQTAGGTAQFYEGYGWYGATLSEIDPDKMYQLKLTSASSITVVGNCVDVADPIDLAAGWSWIGYKPQQPSEINVALGSLTPTNGDFIQTAGGTAQFYEGYGWYGATLSSMTPNFGYQIKLTNADQLIYPEIDNAFKSEMAPAIKISKEDPNWPTPAVFPYYQTTYYQVLLNGVPIETLGSKLSAWCDGEIRGLVNLDIPPPFIGGPNYPLQMGSETASGDIITFKVYDANTDAVYDIVETIVFESGNIQGSPSNPVVINCIATQQINICGIVTDAVSGAPIEGAIITATTGSGGVAGNPNWPVPAVYPYYQTTYYSVLLNGTPLETIGSQLSAWCDGEIRGLVNLDVPPPFIGGPNYPLQMGSEAAAGDLLTFKIYDAGTDMVYDIVESIIFESGSIQGSPSAPMILNTVPGGETYSTLTGTNGTYCLEDIIAGTYSISAEAENYIGQTVEGVVVEASITQDFELVPECQNAVIYNFPEFLDNACAGEEYAADFTNVTWENGTPVWTVQPSTAGELVNGIFYLDPLYAGGLVTISLLVEAVDPCEDAYAEVVFEVYPLPVVTCPEDFDVCLNDEPWELYGASPAGGIFSGNGVQGGTMYDPSIAGVGNWEITYTYVDDVTGCSNSCSFFITVNPLPEVTCPEDFAVCLNDEPWALYGVTPVGGVFSGTGVVDGTMFDPALAGVGDWEITYTYTNPETGCSNFCTFVITVNALPVFECPAYGPFCIGDEPVFFTEEGEFFYDGAVIPGWTPDLPGSFDIVYVYTDPLTGCSDDCTFTIVVNELPVVTCPGDIEVALDALPITLEGATPIGGFYSGEGVMGTDFYVTVPGDYEITYTYTDPETGCSNFCTFMIYVIDLEPVLTFGNLQWPPEATICLEESFTAYAQVIIENGVLGEFGYEGLTVMFGFNAENTDPSTWTQWYPATYAGLGGTTNRPEYSADLGSDLPLGTYYYASKFMFMDETYYGGFEGGFWNGIDNVSGILTVNDCTVPEILWANLQWPPDGTITFGDDYNVYAQVYIPTITGIDPPSGDINAWIGFCVENVNPTEFVNWVPATFNVFAGNNNEYMANLGAAIPGPGVYYYASRFQYAGGEFVYGGYNGGFWDGVNNVSGILTVNPVCEDAEIIGFPAEVENACAGSAYTIDFTGVEVLNAIEEIWTINPETAGEIIEGVFTLNPEFMGGLVTISLEAVAQEPCAGDYAEVSFEVIPLPVFDCPAYGPFCEGDEAVVFAEPGVFTYNGEVVTGFDPVVAGDYTFVYTETNAFGCSDFCEFVIVVNPLPVFDCPAYGPFCEGDEAIVFAEPGVFTYNGEVVTGFDPVVAGEYTFVYTETNAFGCSDFCEFVITVNPLPVIVEQPVDAEVKFGMDAQFVVVAENAETYQWYGPDGLIEGAVDPALVLTGVTLEDEGDYFVEVSNECGTITSESATLTVNPWTQVIDFNGQVNGMSTYLELIENDIATIFNPIMDTLLSIEFMQPSKVYVPGAVSFDWNEAKGAKTAIKAGLWPTSITVTGYPTLGTEVSLPAGWSLIPVWSQGVVLTADVFGPLGGNLIAAFSIDYSGIYWPAYNIYSLEYLVPGSAYLVALAAPGTIDFNVPLVKSATPGYVSLPINTTTWKSVQMSGLQHNIAITAEALAQLKVGDIIGAFNQNGAIAGMVEINSITENTAIRLYGDDSGVVNGINEGDVLTFKLYRNGETIDLTATFDPEMPNANIFARNGLSSVVTLKAGVTSINDYTSELTVNLYPNPAKEFVNIETNFEISNLKVVNYVGQVVFDQNLEQSNYLINTSSFGPGMYFVQIQTIDGVVITKRLTVN